MDKIKMKESELYLECGCCGDKISLGEDFRYETRGYTPFCRDFDCIDDHTSLYVFDIRDALNSVDCPPLSFDQKYSIFCLLNIWEEQDKLLREEGEQS